MKKTVVLIALAVVSLSACAQYWTPPATPAPAPSDWGYCNYLANMTAADIQARDGGDPMWSRMDEVTEQAREAGQDPAYARQLVRQIYQGGYWIGRHNAEAIHSRTLETCSPH